MGKKLNSIWHLSEQWALSVFPFLISQGTSILFLSGFHRQFSLLWRKLKLTFFSSFPLSKWFRCLLRNPEGTVLRNSLIANQLPVSSVVPLNSSGIFTLLATDHCHQLKPILRHHLIWISLKALSPHPWSSLAFCATISLYKCPSDCHPLLEMTHWSLMKS